MTNILPYHGLELIKATKIFTLLDPESELGWYKRNKNFDTYGKSLKTRNHVLKTFLFVTDNPNKLATVLAPWKPSQFFFLVCERKDIVLMSAAQSMWRLTTRESYWLLIPISDSVDKVFHGEHFSLFFIGIRRKKKVL